MEKSYGDAFADTRLEQTLAELGVGEMVLTGAARGQCTRCTTHSAAVPAPDLPPVAGGPTPVDLTEFGLPDPATVIGFMDSVAAFGMEWPGRRARSVTAPDVGF